VRTRTIHPFGHTARLLRGLSDPLINPIERRLHKSGGNPVNAPWWLFGAGVVGGIAIVTVANWVAAALSRASYAVDAGPAGIFWLVVHGAGQLLLLALLLRVLGSWVGVGRYTPWMRPAYIVTDWIVEPLRKVLPSMGPLDISPLIAWFIIQIVLGRLPR
jgi:YggT family protein